MRALKFLTSPLGFSEGPDHRSGGFASTTLALHGLLHGWRGDWMHTLKISWEARAFLLGWCVVHQRLSREDK